MNEKLIILRAFIIFCIVIAIWSTMWQEMIFEKIGDYGDIHWPKWLQKIVFLCPICGVPYYGTPIYWVLFGNGWIKSWLEWIVVILVAMGMAAVFVKVKKI